MLRRLSQHYNLHLVACFRVGRFCSSKTNNHEAPSSDVGEKYQALLKELEGNQACIEEMKKASLAASDASEREKRSFEEREKNTVKTANQAFAKSMIEVCDALSVTCQRISEYLESTPDALPNIRTTLEGIQVAERLTLKILERHGVNRIDISMGSKFDGKRAMCLFTTPSSETSDAGNISHIVKHGYSMDDFVLRHAEVGVSEDP